ncbi:MAG: endoribonuclease MazF [Spirochaetales bacterium]|nr:endoribonuclease MazF [Spirochaetales bacterium]
MVNKTYIPEKGDLIWLNFNPQTGHEQAGNRPAIVLSPKKYNEKTHLLIACPISSKEKGYPFEVPLSGNKIQGVVLADQVKNVDWQKREAIFIEKSKKEDVLEVLIKLLTILEH